MRVRVRFEDEVEIVKSTLPRTVVIKTKHPSIVKYIIRDRLKKTEFMVEVLASKSAVTVSFFDDESRGREIEIVERALAHEF